ncbi:MAG: hypothetical protein JSV63_01490 [Candidatus Aenigmatarchaeota archaeon]|nr:MAG: hypothetical protein JSV63_01490 [Candidatus Aenigmarchaeota archaeon]
MATRELFEDFKPRKVLLPQDIAEGFLAQKARETGIISMKAAEELGVNPMAISNEPVYTGPFASILRDYAEPVLDSMKRYFGERGAVPYFGNVKISAEKLPTYWGLFIQKTRNGLRIVPKVVGKVFGTYDPRSDAISVDPVTFKDNDPEAKYMLMKPEGVKKTLAHEFAHSLQKWVGTLWRHTISDTEAEAEEIGAEITGTEPRAYPKERKSFRKRYNGWITDIGSYAKEVKRNYIDPILVSLNPQPPLATVPVSSYRGR